MQSSTAGPAQLLVEMDIMLLLLMWERPLRGNDIGTIVAKLASQTSSCMMASQYRHVHPQDSCNAYPAQQQLSSS